MIDFESVTDLLGSNRSLLVNFGRVISVSSKFVVSKGPACEIGAVCLVGIKKEKMEVISIEHNKVTLMPYNSNPRVKIGDEVYQSEVHSTIINPNDLLGCAINSNGEILNRVDKEPKKKINLSTSPTCVGPFERERIDSTLVTGIKVIDSLISIGEGQKIGLFAGAGVGKSTLLGMVARNALTDVNVVALIGERGREVREFIEKELGDEGLRRTILVVSTMEESPLAKKKATLLAMSIAEYFRDQGKRVLFMMDSVTRFAYAQKEIDIAKGERVSQGRTPSMQSTLEQFFERCGKVRNGSITGIFTLLVEGEDFDGPIPDISRGILDGHIILTRALADKGHFPAVDVLASLSRVMQDVVDENQILLAKEIRKNLAIYHENETAFKLNLYKLGTDPEIDKAIRLYKPISIFLQQAIEEKFSYEETLRGMGALFS